MYSDRRHTKLAIARAVFTCLALVILSGPFSTLRMPNTGRASAASASVASGTSAASSNTAPASFAVTEFQELWQRTDGPVAAGQVSRSWVWGPGPGTTLTEQGTGGTSRQVQYFDKARMELNPAVTDPKSAWRVTTGLLVSEMVSGRVQTGDTTFTTLAPANTVLAGDDTSTANPRYSDFTKLATLQSVDHTGAPVTDVLTPGGVVGQGTGHNVLNAAFIAETHHNLPDIFLQFMNSKGKVAGNSGTLEDSSLFDWVYVMGYPITEAYWTRTQISGKTYDVLVQLFQRRVLTYVPDFPAGWQVQMGNVGQHYYSWRYNTKTGASGGSVSGAAPAATATAVPTVPVAPVTTFKGGNGFVGIDGDSFTYEGSKVKIKGSNYWISTAPFVATWSNWDGPQALAELKHARDLGVNAIRVGLPYDHFDTMDIVWTDKKFSRINPIIVNQMTQLLQIASVYGMKVIFVLYEWYDNYPEPGTTQGKSNSIYLQGLVGPFANDDRVLAWDLHNEPDNYGGWQGDQQSKVIKWLQRTYNTVRSIDSRHPITIGVGNYKSLWQPAADGTRLIDFVDFVAFHCYDAGALQSQLADLKSRTGKPLLLEEMGWPTKPGQNAPAGTVMTEAQQSYLYTTMLSAVKQANSAGLMQWTLYDFPVRFTTDGKLESYEEHFGLLNLNSSWKPAASIFRDLYQARTLPSEVESNVRLTPR